MTQPFSARNYAAVETVVSPVLDLSAGDSYKEPVYLNMQSDVEILSIHFVCSELLAAAGTVFVGDKDDTDEFAGAADNIPNATADEAIVPVAIIEGTVPRGTAVYIQSDASGGGGEGYVVIRLGVPEQDV